MFMELENIRNWLMKNCGMDYKEIFTAIGKPILFDGKELSKEELDRYLEMSAKINIFIIGIQNQINEFIAKEGVY